MVRLFFVFFFFLLSDIASGQEFSNPRPIYPALSKRLGEQGTVLLRVLITADGKAGAVEIKKSSGFERLDRAAIEAVKQWKFNPATLDGKPIDDWHLVSIPFKLEN